jgi:histidine ammonia-lyase
MMTGIGSLVASAADRLLSLEIRLGSLALELVRAYEDSLAPALHALRPHPGQQRVAAEIRSLLDGSRRLRKRPEVHRHYAHLNAAATVTEIDDDVQDVYSFRCIPQILGPIADTLDRARSGEGWRS